MAAIERGDLAHARLPVFERKVERALGLIQRASERGRTGVSFSGGKDSTVTLHLVRQIVPDVVAAFYDSGCEYEDSTAMAEHYGAEVIQPEMSLLELCRYGGYWGYAHPADAEVDVNFKAFLVTEPAVYFAEKYGLDVVALGLRAQESAGRRMNARKRGEYYQAKDMGVWHLCPLASWTDNDVWAYIASRGLRYHTAYDKMAALGLPRKAWRVSLLMSAVAAQWGGLAVLRQIEPERFRALAAEFPRILDYT